MRYFKVIEDGYITSVGIGSLGIEVDIFAYNEIVQAFNNKPDKLGFEYKLNASNLVWDEFEGDRSALSDDEVRDIYKEEILANVKIHKKPKVNKIGYVLKQIFEPGDNAVVWVSVPDPKYKAINDGTDFIQPMLYFDGMEVEAGKFYSNGEYTWDAIKTGTPKNFFDEEYFFVVGL